MKRRPDIRASGMEATSTVGGGEARSSAANGQPKGMDMRLSEAMREGCRQSNAHVGSYLIGVPGDSFFGACALGAAAVGAGIDEADIHGAMLVETWPELTHWTACPECGVEDELFTIVAHHLNDHHRWTREAIADFIDAQTIELPVTVRTAVPA